jgi:16S rRNA G1207 methylase RsmC
LDNPLDFYRTPAEVIDRMIEVAGDMSHGVVLEPSAGDGAIVEKVIEKYPTTKIYVAEIDDKRAMKLREKFGSKIKTIFTDFMECSPTRPDYVLMNPPFTSQEDKLAYIAHIQKAYELLLEGGRLVAIAPSGLKYRSDKRTAAFRDVIEAHGTIEDLPAGAFGDSGTMVSTVLVSMVK